MTTHTWIRFTSPELGVRRGVKTLHLSNAAAVELAERLNAGSTWTRDGERRELEDFWHWYPERGQSVHYVRAHPTTALGRQGRDQLLGPELIRRFDLTPHIVVHLVADGTVLWDHRVPATHTAAAWAACNGSCAVACDRRYAVGTHASNNLDDVTCKACRAHAESLAVVTKKLNEGCGIESRLVKGVWQHLFIEPKEASL